MRVWIAQCLCPARHCIIAVTGEADSADAAQGLRASLRWSVAEMLRQQTINPWCSLCGAAHTTWNYEVGRMVFRTMAEALPHLHEVEKQQAVTRALWGDLHRTKPQ